MSDTTPAGASALPLFYKQPLLLNANEHSGKGLKAHDGYGFAADVVAVPLNITEFAVASRDYPIVFADNDSAAPLAVLGLKQGRNLFVDGDGKWREGAYIPSYIRRYPFILFETQDKERRLLSIDAASPRYADLGEGVDPFFEGEGKPTPLAQSAIDFCRAFHNEHLATVPFAEAVNEAGLLVTNRAEMQFPDNSRYTLDGFRVVDEAKFRDLADDKVLEWHRKGWLPLLAFALASQRNWRTLLTINGQSTAAQAA